MIRFRMFGRTKIKNIEPEKMAFKYQITFQHFKMLELTQTINVDQILYVFFVVKTNTEIEKKMHFLKIISSNIFKCESNQANQRHGVVRS